MISQLVPTARLIPERVGLPELPLALLWRHDETLIPRFPWEVCYHQWMAQLTEEQSEALAGMDARPGPSRMPDSYFEAVVGPEVAALIRKKREERIVCPDPATVETPSIGSD